jgi:CRISPR system Cascade subunit CasA
VYYVPTFNLVTELWIPVREGEALKLVSLEQALLEGHRYTRIEDPSPLVTVSLHRLLLAVLHRALEGPEDAWQAAEWFKSGFDTAKVQAYLERHCNRFDLFHEETPFYQIGDFTPERSSRSWTVLAPELNSDNNKVLFDHTVTSKPRPLHPAEAARLLVANQTFAISAGKSVLCHTSTAPVATAALVLVQGETLHQTLCLNLVAYPERERKLDVATWEQPPLQVADMKNCDAARASAKGIVHRYTWLSRSIRLHPEEENGETTVRWIAYASGMRFEEAAVRPDPMVAFRRDAKDPQKVYPLGFREGRALWRDFASLLPRPGDHSLEVVEHARNLYGALGRGFRDRNLPIYVAGFANDQAKIELWRGEVYRLPEAILSDREVWRFIEENLEKAEAMGRVLHNAARALAKELLTLGDRQPHKDDVSKLAQSFPHQTTYWTTLESRFSEWLGRLGIDFDDARLAQDWQRIIKQEALRAWQFTRLAAGDDARALRAIYKSEGILLGHIYKQKEVAGAKGS